MQSNFTEKVLKVVAGISRGEVLSYGEVAGLAGSPGAARAVGNIMMQNYRPNIPCHRVIRADGSLGKYNRGDAAKRKLLREEEYLK